MDWDPDFLDRSPMLEPLRARAAALSTHGDWPAREALQALVAARGVATARGAPLQLVGTPGSEPYEWRIHERGEMHLRERDWHDLFNALVWLVYPETKAALNHAQCSALLTQRMAGNDGSGRRGRVRDALTLFDENGAVVISSKVSLLEELRSFRWKSLFWDRRDEVRTAMRFFVFGHALLEKALRPYVGMTAHAILLPADEALIAQPLSSQIEAVDALVADVLPSIDAPACLSPLPVLGVPGWWSGNEEPEFYDNGEYFRPRRVRSASDEGRSSLQRSKPIS